MPESRECQKCEGFGFVNRPDYGCGDPLCRCDMGTMCDECEGTGEIEDDDPRWTLTDLGRTYRTAMQSGAKLNGEVKAGEG